MSTDQLPAFFIPQVDLEKHEECYAELARAAGCSVLPLNERIYSITFRSKGETWTATVGKQLHGSVTRMKTVRGKRTERTMPLSNSSVVMAIFPGVPFQVWHNGASRVWSNPFLAGEPNSVVRFAPSGAT